MSGADVSDPKLDQINLDLEYVQLPLAKPDDVLLVRRLPNQQLKKHWIDCGFKPPEFCLVDEIESLQNRKLNRVEPWAWSPDSFSKLEQIESTLRHKPTPWSDGRAALYRKSSDFRMMAAWLEKAAAPEWMAGRECFGIPVGKCRSLSSALRELKERGFTTAIYKPEFGASGRGTHRIDVDAVIEKNSRSMSRPLSSPCWSESLTFRFFGISGETAWHSSSVGLVRKCQKVAAMNALY